jgi:hypothetical protein
MRNLGEVEFGKRYKPALEKITLKKNLYKALNEIDTKFSAAALNPAEFEQIISEHKLFGLFTGCFYMQRNNYPLSMGYKTSEQIEDVFLKTSLDMFGSPSGILGEMVKLINIWPGWFVLSAICNIPFEKMELSPEEKNTLTALTLQAIEKCQNEQRIGQNIADISAKVSDTIFQKICTVTSSSQELYKTIFPEGFVFGYPPGTNNSLVIRNLPKGKGTAIPWMAIQRKLARRGIFNFSEWFEDPADVEKLSFVIQKQISNALSSEIIRKKRETPGMAKRKEHEIRLKYRIGKDLAQKTGEEEMGFTIRIDEEDKTFIQLVITPEIKGVKLLGFSIPDGNNALTGSDFRTNFEAPRDKEEEHLGFLTKRIAPFIAQTILKGIPISSKYTYPDDRTSGKRFMIYTDFETNKELIRHLGDGVYHPAKLNRRELELMLSPLIKVRNNNEGLPFSAEAVLESLQELQKLTE